MLEENIHKSLGPETIVLHFFCLFVCLFQISNLFIAFQNHTAGHLYLSSESRFCVKIYGDSNAFISDIDCLIFLPLICQEVEQFY